MGPIGLDYIGYALKKAGYEINFIDHAFSDLKESLQRYFKNNNPLAIGITVRNTDTCLFQGQAFFLDEVRELITYLNSVQDAPVILGGVGFSIAPKAVIEYCGAEYGIWGEGEVALPRFLKALQTDQEFAAVPNLIFRKDEVLMQNPTKFMDFKEFHPPRDLINNERYFTEGGQGNIETKRGCDQKCIYCADPICKGSKVRLKPPKSVYAEFQTLINQGVDCFHLCDSEFNNHLAHAKAVCREIIKGELQTHMTWYAYCCPTPFDEELAQLMKEAGCAGINFGVDSGDDETLRTLGHSYNPSDIIRLTEICKAHEIVLMYDLLIGGPGETKASVKTTIDLMKEVQPDRAGFSIGVRVYSGTKLAQIVQEEGPLMQNPNIYGVKENNVAFLKPLYYLSSDMGGESIFSYIAQLVGTDPMWFFADPRNQDSNYNYNENFILVDAIKKGYRGAYWDIMRRLKHIGTF